MQLVTGIGCAPQSGGTRAEVSQIEGGRRLPRHGATSQLTRAFKQGVKAIQVLSVNFVCYPSIKWEPRATQGMDIQFLYANPIYANPIKVLARSLSHSMVFSSAHLLTLSIASPWMKDLQPPCQRVFQDNRDTHSGRVSSQAEGKGVGWIEISIVNNVRFVC